jgi:hypothetical protein
MVGIRNKKNCPFLEQLSKMLLDFPIKVKIFTRAIPVEQL